MNPDWLKLAVYACPIATIGMIAIATYVFHDLRRANEATSDFPTPLQGDLPALPKDGHR